MADLTHNGAPPFAVTETTVLAVFVGASVATETIYQRHAWFLLGLALAVPVTPKQGSTATVNR